LVVLQYRKYKRLRFCSARNQLDTFSLPTEGNGKKPTPLPPQFGWLKWWGSPLMSTSQTATYDKESSR
jgi:hypothetical protein